MLSEDVGYAEYVNAAFTVENSRQSLRADALAILLFRLINSRWIARI